MLVVLRGNGTVQSVSNASSTGRRVPGCRAWRLRSDVCPAGMNNTKEHCVLHRTVQGLSSVQVSSSIVSGGLVNLSRSVSGSGRAGLVQPDVQSSLSTASAGCFSRQAAWAVQVNVFPCLSVFSRSRGLPGGWSVRRETALSQLPGEVRYSDESEVQVPGVRPARGHTASHVPAQPAARLRRQSGVAETTSLAMCRSMSAILCG